MIKSIREELEKNIKKSILSVVVDGYDDLDDDVRENLKYEDYSDITLAFHDNFYHNPEAIADITIAFIEGGIETDEIAFPIFLSVEVNEEYESIMFKALLKMGIALNEKTISLANETYRWFFNTPQTAGKFKDVGIKQRVGISVNLTLSTFKNVLDVEYLKIDNEYIKFSNITFTYAVETNSTGAINSSRVTLCGETAVLNIIFNAVPRNIAFFQACRDKMIDCLDANHQWNVEIKFVDSLKTLKCIIANASYVKAISGFPSMQITIARSDN